VDQADAERFAKCLLGGKALGKEPGRIANAGKLGTFPWRKQFRQGALTVPLVQLAEAGNGDDVGTDAGDHGREGRASDRACASRSRRFISPPLRAGRRRWRG
jgi:hypothetical protein